MPRKTRWENVLRAAAELFAANGYAAASLSQLARSARLSKPGIYYHVRNKEELLFRICDSTMLKIACEATKMAAILFRKVVMCLRLIFQDVMTQAVS